MQVFYYILVYFLVEGRVQLIADKKMVFDLIDPLILKHKIFNLYHRFFAFKEMVKGSFLGEVEIIQKINR